MVRPGSRQLVQKHPYFFMLGISVSEEQGNFQGLGIGTNPHYIENYNDLLSNASEGINLKP